MSDQRIKLVQIIADSDLSGGPTHVLGILKHIDQKKFDLALICPAGNLTNEAKKIKGVEVYNLPIVSKFDFIAIFEIRSILNKIRSKKDPFGPMIVHTHGTRAGFLGRLAIPHGVKSVYTEHRWDADYHLKSKVNERIQKDLLAIQNYRSDLVIAVSSSVKSFLVKNKLAQAKKVAVIPNGIDVSAFSSQHSAVSRIRENNRHPVIGTIGNLNTQKGQRYLIDAMVQIVKQYPLLKLEIIGEGEERQSLECLIVKNDLEQNITILGKQKDVYKYLKRWDVFVLPSVAETFGIVVLEAMSAGVPVVASRVGGISDIITNKKNGLMVEACKPKLIADAVCNVLAHPVMAATLKRGGLARVKEYDWEKVVKILESRYVQLFD